MTLLILFRCSLHTVRVNCLADCPMALLIFSLLPLKKDSHSIQFLDFLIYSPNFSTLFWGFCREVFLNNNWVVRVIPWFFPVILIPVEFDSWYKTVKKLAVDVTLLLLTQTRFLCFAALFKQTTFGLLVRWIAWNILFSGLAPSSTSIQEFDLANTNTD